MRLKFEYFRTRGGHLIHVNKAKKFKFCQKDHCSYSCNRVFIHLQRLFVTITTIIPFDNVAIFGRSASTVKRNNSFYTYLYCFIVNDTLGHQKMGIRRCSKAQNRDVDFEANERMNKERNQKCVSLVHLFCAHRAL